MMSMDDITEMLAFMEKEDDAIMDRVYDDPDSVIEHLKSCSTDPIHGFMTDTSYLESGDSVLRGNDGTLPPECIVPVPGVPPLPSYHHTRMLPMPFWRGTNGRDKEGRPRSVTLEFDVNGLLLLKVGKASSEISRMSIAAYNNNTCQIVFYARAIPTQKVYTIFVSRLDYDLIALCTFLKSNHAINHGDMWTWPIVFIYTSFPPSYTSWVLDTVNYDRPCLRLGMAKQRPVFSYRVGNTYDEMCTISMKLEDEQDMVILTIPFAVVTYMISTSTFSKQGDFVCGQTRPKSLAYTMRNTTSQVATELGPDDMSMLSLKFS